MTTSQNNPFAAWQSLWQTQAGSVGQTSNTAQNFWQANACYWQTVNSIMSARGTSVAQWWQQAPQFMSELAGCTSAPQFIETCMKWQARTTAQALQLNETTQAERAHLYKQWQQLASRSGYGNTTPTSSQTNWPQTRSTPASGISTTTRQPMPNTQTNNSSTGTTSAWQPNFLPGRFIAGPRNTGTHTTTVTGTTQPLVQAVTTPVQNTATENTGSVQPQVSSTSTTFSRSSTAAAQVLGATTRRSVLARNASRPRRAAGGR